jgi:hypothetical protein
MCGRRVIHGEEERCKQSGKRRQLNESARLTNLLLNHIRACSEHKPHQSSGEREFLSFSQRSTDFSDYTSRQAKETFSRLS